MNKIALIGGKDLKKYSIANVLWDIINRVSNRIEFNFSMYELVTSDDLGLFFEMYKSNEDFIGFNVALPWKSEIIKFLDLVDFAHDFPLIVNTVYKTANIVHGDNTDILGIKNALLFSGVRLNTIKKVLVLGLGGAGMATAIYFSKLGKKVYGYDLTTKPRTKDIVLSKSLNEVAATRYDLVINATPVGKYFFDKVPESFESPLSFSMLKNITREATIIQEMNYFPGRTSLLEMGEQLGLKTISGILMLVFQAIESYQRYFNVKLSDMQVNSILEEMVQYVSDKEKLVFKLNITNNGFSK